MSRVTVYATCGLCSARTPAETCSDHFEAVKKTDAHLDRMGFVSLSVVKIPDGRRRFECCVCADCARDIVAASAPASAPAVPS